MPPSDPLQTDWPLAIIGPGKVGTAIGVLAAGAGWPLAAVAGGGLGRAQQAAEAIGHGIAALSPAEAAKAGKLILLTVPDGAIQAVCEQLAGGGAFSPGCVVAHCCGALGSEALSAARNVGCHVGSFHPLQTFPTVASAIAHLGGTWCFCEGDSAAMVLLTRLAEAIGARAVPIGSAGKALYHAAGVTASNYLVALMDAAARMAELAGVDRATWTAAVEPLVRATVDNVFQLGPAEALTGPIQRGDAGTVRRHLRALDRCDPAVRDLYAAGGRYTVELALRSGSIDADTAAALMDILKAPPGAE